MSSPLSATASWPASSSPPAPASCLPQSLPATDLEPILATSDRWKSGLCNYVERHSLSFNAETRRRRDLDCKRTSDGIFQHSSASTLRQRRRREKQNANIKTSGCYGVLILAFCFSRQLAAMRPTKSTHALKDPLTQPTEKCVSRLLLRLCVSATRYVLVFEGDAEALDHAVQ